ncbi:PREDICTED: uncharacterized protein LOC108566050 [Nicrophorus vespilloides]|uniref:Uncharacterized protein LOC108566050 n=1 Tax=Nicrophorus vespilloides TaxID=110193 RepID=A0ABM1N335_NICVS|nr:PREDICTED: uncharacterized protein LOC108566050 [Nicrophorus vespilloides]
MNRAMNNMEEIVPILDENVHSDVTENASAIMEHESPYVMVSDIQVRNIEEIVPILDDNVYIDVSENASAISEHESPYVMVNVPQCSNQGNVSPIMYNDRFTDKTEDTYETLPEIDDIMSESDDISEETDEDPVHSISELSEFSETAEELQKELKIQQNIIVQSKKALQASADYNFNGRIEEMEARRFLLIAETTRNMIEERLRNISLDLEGNGVVKFKNFRFSKKSMSVKLLTKVFKKQKSETRLWFMIMMSYGKVVSANKVLEKSDHIVFEDELVFERLQVDFDLTMYLYCVSLKKEPKKKSGKSVENYWDLAAKFVFDKDDLRSNNLVL